MQHSMRDVTDDLWHWHCLCHTIKLHAADNRDELADVSHFSAFMYKLYSVYGTTLRSSVNWLHVQNNYKFSCAKSARY